jgi:LysM repeat protein
MMNNITQRGQNRLKFHIRHLITRIVTLLLLCTVSFSFTVYSAGAQETGPVFTENFDTAFKPDPFCKTGACDTPAGWGVWFIPRRETDQPGINFQPNYTQIDTANRVKSGKAQRIYTENATHTGGIFRIVNDVKVGAKLRFSVWGQAWSTNDESPISARPSTDIRLKIGIDPMGGNDGQASPLNGQVVWSEEKDAKDAYTQFSVETVAKSQTVFVYLYATMKDPVRHNEIFWDDAVLEYTAPAPEPTISVTVQTGDFVTGTAMAASELVTPTESAPAATPLPQASSAVTYTVVSGDTLFGIALKFDKSVEELRRLNAMKDDVLSIGQVLVITAAVQPEVVVQEATAAPTSASVITVTATPSTGALCVQAYFDNNGNGKRDQSEDLIPNILFSVSTKGQTINSYTTDGVNEPFCIGNLAVAAYTVAATIMPAYVPTTPLNDTINVPGGAAAQFSIGLRRVSDGNAVVGGTITPTPQGGGSSGLNVGSLLLTIGGGLLILGTLGFGVLYFMQNRRM